MWFRFLTISAARVVRLVDETSATLPDRLPRRITVQDLVHLRANDITCCLPPSALCPMAPRFIIHTPTQGDRFFRIGRCHHHLPGIPVPRRQSIPVTVDSPVTKSTNGDIFGRPEAHRGRDRRPRGTGGHCSRSVPPTVMSPFRVSFHEPRCEFRQPLRPRGQHQIAHPPSVNTSASEVSNPSLTRSRSRIPGSKCGAYLAPIDTGVPVLGLRTIRARR